MGSGKDFDTKIYFITDSTGFAVDEFMWRVESALQGGVNIMQLREKNRTTREYILLADKVHIIAKKYNVPLIIDDRIDVAMAVDAEGVHLGQSDMPVYIARKILGDSIIIGATAKTVPQAVEAYDQGADYLGVGAIYPTTTKVKTVLTSTDTLRDICAAVPIKVNAIGGLNKNNIDNISEKYIFDLKNEKNICEIGECATLKKTRKMVEKYLSQLQVG